MEEESLFYLDEIEPRGIFMDLIRNLWVIVLAMLAGILLVAAYFNSPFGIKYTSEATIAIVNTTPSNVYSSLSSSASMADALSNVFSSDILWDKLEEELGYEPLGALKVSQIDNTNLVLLQMTADQAGEARKELKFILENYEQFSDNIFSNAKLSILSQPSMPTAPSNPVSPVIYALGAACAACSLCIAFVVIASILRRTVKNKVSAERWLEARVYGVIGHETKTKVRRHGKTRKNTALLISNPACSFAFEEAFNRLASRIVFHMEQSHQQVLLVTSSAENEGKSTVLANIALAMAKRGKKVLLIDTDLRKPALYKVFDYNKEDIQFYGLDEYLKNGGDMDELVVHDEHTGLDLIMCKNPSGEPESLLSSGRLKKLIQTMQERVDYVVLDSPPAGFLGDAELLAGRSDAAIFVVRHDCIPVDQINYVVENLKNSGVDFLGCILNDMYSDVSSFHGRKSDYYGYAGKKAKYSKFNTRNGNEV